MEDAEGSLHIDVTSEAFDAADTDSVDPSTSDSRGISLEVSNDGDPSSPVATFVDGQAVQLEDGRTAHIYRRISEDTDTQIIQLVELDDGTTTYIQATSSAMTQTEPSDEDKLTSFKCDKPGCGKLYQSAHHLRVHKRAHTGEKPFKCEWKDCGKSFSTSYTLKSHTRVHTGEKPYDCSFAGCSKAFKTAGDLQKHTRTHTGEKPFKCPFDGCGKAFTTSNICKVHIRTHTGERPYKCPFQDCEKTFSTATNYNNHYRIHTGEKPFSCEWPGCGRRFTEYSSFYKHQVVHTDRNIFSCCHCGKFYTYSSTLIGHKKTVHNDDSSKVLNSERVRAGKRKSPLDVSDGTAGSAQDNKNAKKSMSTSAQSGVLLLPVHAINPDSSESTSSSRAHTQVAAVLTAGTGQQLAILSHNGSQQFTLALTDHGSTVLLPPAENASSDAAPKSDEQVTYIEASEEHNSRSMMSMIEKDNTLQRIEASEGDTPAAETTPINADIWLHQPQNEDISAVIEVKDEEASSKDVDNINIHFESSQNPCEDANPTDSIAYLEIGGAKYQLKIVSAENESVDEICVPEQSDNSVNLETDIGASKTSGADDEKFNVQSFLNSAETVSEDAKRDDMEIVHYIEDRIDPEGSQRCEPFSKKKKM